MTLLVLLTGILALGGVWLIADFALWFFTGHVVPATIQSFEKGMPVLSFETIEGKKIEMKASEITHIGYRLGRPQEGDIFNAIYREHDGAVSVRVYGFLYLLGGTLLLIPFLAALALKFSKGWALGQLSFLVVLIGIVLGCWILMKLVRRNY